MPYITRAQPIRQRGNRSRGRKSNHLLSRLTTRSAADRMTTQRFFNKRSLPVRWLYGPTPDGRKLTPSDRTKHQLKQRLSCPLTRTSFAVVEAHAHSTSAGEDEVHGERRRCSAVVMNSIKQQIALLSLKNPPQLRSRAWVQIKEIRVRHRIWV